MDYRIGTCSQCGAEYKVPASFAHSQARCKKCSGTVNLGEVQGSQPAAMPAKKVVPRPKPMEEVDTSGAEGKRKERGTLARLRAERAAAPQEQPVSPAPAPVSEEPKAPAKAAPVTKAKPAARSSKRSSGSSGSKSRRSRSVAKGEESKGSSRRKRSKPEKKKAPVGMIAIIALVVGGGAFAAFQFLGGSDDAAAKDSKVATDEQPADTAMDEAQPAEPADDTNMDEAAMDGAEDAKEAMDDAPATESTPMEKPEKVDVLVDLAALERCKPARGTTDEEWEQMNGWISDFLDPDSGAAGPRAGKKLGNLGRKGMPVLINGMLGLDYSTEEGINTGDTVQRMLKTIANGNSFGWWYFDNPRSEYLCRKASESWHATWKRVEDDIEVFIKLAKLEQEYDGDGEDPLGPLRAQRMAEAASLREMFGSTD